ncbi:hypothetical protein [Ferrimonas marina]|uniref:Uncharacterized protein n=1 Tax=Ferrimonas marina TaxID=299255 RepID=A0A1M5T9U9_9GAMM|nr:hypothetical protein [Ferrimonas marina]SHH47545.1 hypothetical protein SAMN02745129_2056 [Ferrimonas marina]
MQVRVPDIVSLTYANQQKGLYTGYAAQRTAADPSLLEGRSITRVGPGWQIASLQLDIIRNLLLKLNRRLASPRASRDSLLDLIEEGESLLAYLDDQELAGLLKMLNSEASLEQMRDGVGGLLDLVSKEWEKTGFCLQLEAESADETGPALDRLTGQTYEHPKGVMLSHGPIPDEDHLNRLLTP